MYTSINEYLKSIYNKKVYKLSLSSGCSCPNRDGTLGNKGCIFCDGAGAFAAVGSIDEQIKQAKERVKNKVKEDSLYIAYFQSFTNTYADETYLENLYKQVLEYEDIVILSIATRPDCISDKMYEILENLNKIKPVWIELGLQTIHEKSAAYIRRGYELSIYDECMRRLKELGIYVIVHQIIGLPDEDENMLLETTDYIVKSGADGIKFHLLHILKNTDLATEYENGNIRVLSLEEYINLLKACISVLPKKVSVHRLTGDGAKKDLLAPLWSGDKKRVLNAINKALNV